MRHSRTPAAGRPGARRALLASLAGLAGLAGLVGALAACSTYQPPTGPAERQARIGIDPRTPRLKFVAVDGVYVSAAGGFITFGGRDELLLAAGQRAVTVQFVDGQLRKGGQTLAFEAEAGRRYTVHEHSDARQFTSWITDDLGRTVTTPATAASAPRQPP